MALVVEPGSGPQGPPDDVRLVPQVLAHYELVGPLMEKSFAGDPTVFVHFPNGFGLGMGQKRITDIPLSTRKLLYLVHSQYAIEFHGWAPRDHSPDETRLRFGKILLETRSGYPTFDRVQFGAQRMRRHLADQGVDAIALHDGQLDGIALWIPLPDAPEAVPLRLWLHHVCDIAVAADPDLFTTEPNTHDNGRIHLHVSCNARHHYSALPYSLRGALELPVVTPVTWDEVGALAQEPFTAATFPQRLAEKGDVWEAELKRIGAQSMPQNIVMLSLDLLAEPRGHIIHAAVTILEQGGLRTAQEILVEALRRKLVPANTTVKYVYSALIEYIARTNGHGRKPLIVEDGERRFRINEPLDDWPAIPHDDPKPDDGLPALIDRLQKTSTGDDYAAFEIACCDAFSHLGFLTRHLGGEKEPDGVALAQFGPLAYRVMLECKTGKHIVEQPDAAEAAKFVDAFNADFAVMIGPDFSDEIELLDELKTHRVTAMTVTDLVTLLTMRANFEEVRSVLQPGFASDPLWDLTWEREHGHAKRVTVVAALIHREGWASQVAAAEQSDRGEAPHLTVDAAMLLVDAALKVAGSTQACTREEVEAAFEYLTHPLVQIATWLDASRAAIAILSSPRIP
jgi:DNA primase